MRGKGVRMKDISWISRQQSQRRRAGAIIVR